MSLSVVKDLSKYTRSGNRGEIIFAKKGLLARRARITFILEIDKLMAAYTAASPDFYEFRVANLKTNFIVRLVSGSTTEANWSDVPGADKYGQYSVTTLANFSAIEFFKIFQGSILNEFYEMNIFHLYDYAYSIEFIAKEDGSDYNLTLSSRTTAGGSWTYDHYPWSNFTTANAIDRFYENYRLHLRVLVDDQDRAEVLKEVYSTYHTTGTIDGDATIFTFSEVPWIVKNYMAMDAIADPYRVLIGNSVRKFRVEFYEEWDYARSPMNYFLIDEKYATLSAIDQDKIHLKDQTVVSLNNSQDLQYIAPGQPAWFSILVREEDVANSPALYFYLLRYGLPTQTTVRTPAPSGSLSYFFHHSHIIHIPVLFTTDTNADVHRVEVEVCADKPDPWETRTTLANRTYHIDNKNYAIDRWFYYLNSMGGIDTIRLFGDSEDSMVLTPSDYEIVQSNGVEKARYNIATSKKTKGMSGWIDRSLSDMFQDFIHSRFIYEVDKSRMPSALAVDQINLNSNDFARRHCLNAMMSHPVVITSKEVSIPRMSDGLVAFKIDIERSVQDFGFFNKTLFSALPKLQEDIFEFTVNYENSHTGSFLFEFTGKVANLELYINGTLISALGLNDPEYSMKSTQFVYSNASNAVHVSVRGNYMRSIQMKYSDGIHLPNTTVSIIKSRFVNLNQFEFNSDSYTPSSGPMTGDKVFGLDKVYMSSWRTLNRFVAKFVSEGEIIKVMNLIHQHRNDNPYTPGLKPNPFNYLEFSYSNIVIGSVGSSHMAFLYYSLTRKGISVNL